MSTSKVFSSNQVTSLLSAKQNSITGAASTITDNNLTANYVLMSNSSGKVAISGITTTKLNYLSGVTSNIQTQLDDKMPHSPTYIGAASVRTGTILISNISNYTFIHVTITNTNHRAITIMIPIDIISWDAWEYFISGSAYGEGYGSNKEALVAVYKSQGNNDLRVNVDSFCWDANTSHGGNYYVYVI